MGRVKKTETVRPPVWQMVREAVESLDKDTSYKEIKEYIWHKHGDVKERTINCQIIICSVNQKSRIYYPPNRKPRACDSKYDFLYSLGNGRVTLYDPGQHGQWGIVADGEEVTVARIDPIDNEPQEIKQQPAPNMSERSGADRVAHLRSFVAHNLNLFDGGWALSAEMIQADGQAMSTESGLIDVLAVDPTGAYIVIQVAENADPYTLTRLLACMGWIEAKLAQGKPTRGIIVSTRADEAVTRAMTVLSAVDCYQVQMSIDLKKVDCQN